ncbi:hypothetical protein [Methanoculleus sp.]|uniref:hypothetical protein n=1 Tax=Methanoculleus sp. TaxID=90427 RepID=UPI002A15E2A0|nr:hypothetical protein [Methanoculleus sp.]
MVYVSRSWLKRDLIDQVCGKADQRDNNCGQVESNKDCAVPLLPDGGLFGEGKNKMDRDREKNAPELTGPQPEQKTLIVGRIPDKKLSSTPAGRKKRCRKEEAVNGRGWVLREDVNAKAIGNKT